MRFQRLDLLAYGKFTDVSLDFPDGTPDLHLIYGPNEAGKSTLRSGAADFLYGIPGQTTLNFQHDYKRMRLGAVVEGGDQVVELTRRKGNKGTLRDAADEPTPDSLLEDLLGGGDRAFYERMFALSHQSLRAGGEEILQGKDDAAETLFAAAAGLSGLHAVRQKLVEEARALWRPGKSKNDEYHRFAEALTEAGEAKKEATAQARDWRAAADARTAADTSYEAAQSELNRLEGRRARLERVRRVAPHLRARNQAVRERAALGEPRLLPSNAGETLTAFRASQAVILDRQGRLRSETEHLERQSGELRPDAVVLAQAVEIDDLVDGKPTLGRLSRDIDKQRTAARIAQEDVLRAARRLGWAEAADQALESRVPSPLKRAELRGLLEGRGAFEARAESAGARLEDSRAKLSDIESKASEQNADPVSPDWEAVLDSARSLRDFADRRVELERALAQSRDEWRRALEALRPWQGEPEQLRQPPPVSDERARHWLNEQRSSQEALRRLDERRREVQKKLEAKRLKLRQLEQDRNPVTTELLQTARQSRDELWRQIASGATTLSESAPAYEDAVELADSAADRRFEGAEAAGLWSNLNNEIEALEQQAAEIDVDHRDEEGRLADQRKPWYAAAAALGADGFALEDYPQWLNARTRALEKADAIDDALAALTNFGQRVEQASVALRQAWARHSALPTPEGDDDLGAWLVRTERAQQSRSESVNLRGQLQAQIESLRNTVGSTEQSASEADKQLQDWQTRFHEALVEVGLPPATSPESASSSLDVFEELDRKLDELRGSRKRISDMQADLDTFALQARHLAEGLAPDWAGRSGEQIADELQRRLHQARQEQDELARLTKALEGKRKAADDAGRELAESEAAIRPLLEDAGTDLDALQAAVERSDEARKLDTLIKDEANFALQEGSPLDLAALEVELDAEEGNDLAAELSTIEIELKEAQRQFQDAIERRKDAEHALDRFPAGDAAARAEARRQEALAEMVVVSERWVRATVGHKLLGWAIQRYRESHQGPLLQRAGELFAELTLGSFERLTVEDTGAGAVIVARRSGEEVGVEAMSDGTLDQLYLALRVAALELHLDKGEPLPFLADDLFVNWDNDRAKAGLRVLAELARHTQVLFLTHHEHLIELAREAVGVDCSILRLGE
jgi:uncharacterized protein YhaN